MQNGACNIEGDTVTPLLSFDSQQDLKANQVQQRPSTPVAGYEPPQV